MLKYRFRDTSGIMGRRFLVILLAFVAVFTMSWLAPAAVAEDKQAQWEQVNQAIAEELHKLPAQAAAGDQDAVVATIRRAYYEIYQVTGLQAEISHNYGKDQGAEFNQDLLKLRNGIKSGEISGEEQVKAAVDKVCANLDKKVKKLATAGELTDRWTRVANEIKDNAEKTVKAYKSGDKEKAYQFATDAYLGHYEANGLEKATIALISQARVNDVEAAFRELRVTAKGDQGVEAVQAAADKLISMVTADAEQLDKMTSKGVGSGWAGFFGAFFVLLREGAEALLVIAALITYLMKADRRDQLPGLIIGIVLALLISAGLAVLFSFLTTSSASGLSQELIEGITGIAAVLMLIYVSNWILSKSHGEAWKNYIKSSLESKSGKGAYALWLTGFLAVLREGSETILFFQPIFAATQNASDKALVWFGIGVAAVSLAVIFVLVWLFGVRLPLQPFFKWTSFLLALMSITIGGGAIKELQDALWIPITPVPGVPTVIVLGLYPTVETLVAQAVITAVLAVLLVLQFKKAKETQKLSASQGVEEKTGENVH